MRHLWRNLPARSTAIRWAWLLFGAYCVFFSEVYRLVWENAEKLTTFMPAIRATGTTECIKPSLELRGQGPDNVLLVVTVQ